MSSVRKQIREEVAVWSTGFTYASLTKKQQYKVEKLVNPIIQTLISSLDKVPIRAVEQYDPFGEHELVALADIKDILTNKKGGR